MLEDVQKITIETDEENPTTIAEITLGEINTADGYRVRLTPKEDRDFADKNQEDAT